jgi:hypothetical protein
LTGSVLYQGSSPPANGPTYMVCRGARIPRNDFAAQRRDNLLPQGCRATPDFAPFHPAIGSVSVNHFNLTKRAKSAIVRQPCGNWFGKGQARAHARTTSSTLAGRTTTSRRKAARTTAAQCAAPDGNASALFCCYQRCIIKASSDRWRSQPAPITSSARSHAFCGRTSVLVEC